MGFRFIPRLASRDRSQRVMERSVRMSGAMTPQVIAQRVRRLAQSGRTRRVQKVLARGLRVRRSARNGRTRRVQKDLVRGLRARHSARNGPTRHAERVPATDLPGQHSVRSDRMFVAKVPKVSGRHGLLLERVAPQAIVRPGLSEADLAMAQNRVRLHLVATGHLAHRAGDPQAVPSLSAKGHVQVVEFRSAANRDLASALQAVAMIGQHPGSAGLRNSNEREHDGQEDEQRDHAELRPTQVTRKNRQGHDTRHRGSEFSNRDRDAELRDSLYSAVAKPLRDSHEVL